MEAACPATPELFQPLPDDVEPDGQQHVSQELRLRRIRNSLGHQSTRLLAQILTEGKAPQSTIGIARDLACPICERMIHFAPSQKLRVSQVGQQMSLNKIGSDSSSRTNRHRSSEPYNSTAVDLEAIKKNTRSDSPTPWWMNRSSLSLILRYT